MTFSADLYTERRPLVTVPGSLLYESMVNVSDEVCAQLVASQMRRALLSQTSLAESESIF